MLPLPWYHCIMLISRTNFKAQCRQLLNLVHETGEKIQITEDGIVVGELRRPAPQSDDAARVGTPCRKLGGSNSLMHALDWTSKPQDVGCAV